MTHTILIVGGGNMGGALAQRWHMAGIPEVSVVEPDETRAIALREMNIPVYRDLASAPIPSTMVLAIKPQQFAEMKLALKSHCPSSTLISIMAGVSTERLSEICPRVARVMPNLPALIGESMSVAYAAELDEPAREFVADLFRAVGDCVWVEDEALLHAATGISGSGPGYVFAFMEALEAAGVAQGLSAEMSRALVIQTLRGAALMAGDSFDSFATLRENVTSPGGTTAAALREFSEANLPGAIAKGVAACVARSKELSS